MFSSLIASIVIFTITAMIIVIAGSRLARIADELVDRTGLGEALFGLLFLSSVTSLPDFVTADVAYPQGSIYHDMAPIQMTWGLVSILMTAILLLGMVKRETYGIGRIGSESALILSVYAIALSIVVVSS